MGDDGNGEWGYNARCIDRVGHRQKPDDVFALECEECRDNADGDDKQTHNSDAARVQNIAPEDSGGVDEAGVCR